MTQKKQDHHSLAHAHSSLCLYPFIRWLKISVKLNLYKSVTSSLVVQFQLKNWLKKVTHEDIIEAKEVYNMRFVIVLFPDHTHLLFMHISRFHEYSQVSQNTPQ